MNIKPNEQIRLLISAPDEGLRQVFNSGKDQIARLLRASEVTIAEQMTGAPRASARMALTGGTEAIVPLEGLIDFAQEQDRLKRELDKLQKEMEKLHEQLSNPQFMERAPAEKVKELQQRVTDIAQRTGALHQMVEALAA